MRGSRTATATRSSTPTTSFTYEPGSGREASRTDPLGNTWTWTFEARAQTFTNPANGDSVEFTFMDAVRKTRPGGSLRRVEPDARGALVRATGARGNETLYTYDAGGRVLTVTNPVGGTTIWTYAASGCPSSRRGSDTGATQVAADPTHRRLERVTDPAGRTVTLAGDANDRLAGVRDPSGGATTYAYDAGLRMTRIQRSNGVATSYEYDGARRVVRIVHGLIADLRYSLDGAGRITGVSGTAPLDAEPWVALADETFAHDAAWRVTSAAWGGTRGTARPRRRGTPTRGTAPTGSPRWTRAT